MAEHTTEKDMPTTTTTTTTSTSKIDDSTPVPVPVPSPRIVCLLPSATEICLRLGLGDSIVGITHECDVSYWKDDIHRDRRLPAIVTANGLSSPDTSQLEIHQAVQEQQQQQSSQAATTSSCSLSDQSSDDVPSLYPILPHALMDARPTVIFTQNLCDVCAPTEQSVHAILQSTTTSSSGGGGDKGGIRIISLQPTTIPQVAETFVTIAQACHVKPRGEALAQEWLYDLTRIQTAIQNVTTTTSTTSTIETTTPSLLLLEWLDPPFDSGHWTYQMMEYARVQNALTATSQTPKSQQVSWKDIYEADPDVIVVGCCGLDLSRNLQDVHRHASSLQPLRATQSQRLYVCNGNDYITMPGPDLLIGTLLLAYCAYQDQPEILQALDALQMKGYSKEKTWQQVNLMATSTSSSTEETSNSKSTQRQRTANLFQPISSDSKAFSSSQEASDTVVDMEDLALSMCGGIPTDTDAPQQQVGFAKVHEQACKAGLKTYTDPETGYQVFTALAHEERGRCCGSGCRHCPYSHENIQTDKALKIQQPSILYQATTEEEDGISLSPSHATIKPLKILFFSGGKDSFLTIRALVKQRLQTTTTQEDFALILLTTFDATTKTIAHQEVSIEQVVQQAQHLNLTLLGVPLRRGSGETYLERLVQALKVIENKYGSRIESLVFGDLHLEHIKEWRDTTFSVLPYRLEYPLWKVDYPILLKDLEDSQVPCVISGCTIVHETIQVGSLFSRELYEKSLQSGLDGFGERGEFHSLAQVWKVSRQTALGL